ncbi:error-prone DNA polymerase [Allorhodopirellula heiligendammensis]|uniref:Error-prone DNA polymerase n=1 Tax=Allorhodopirellula heiligendammensis TaxID=2714739 RepID=A0A5C6C823_9BACT|nr:error-prone DNA polymerase [Allorhodopirellula heiligendammensis]TWU19661.1 Error-prone DNA polymerase [Allorhodopirellula heiligendammensis]
MQYVELHCRSNFSFLEAASHPDELVQRAAELGYAGLALTDRESIAGVVRGHAPAKELGLQYIVGTEVHPIDAPAMVLWPTDRAAYGRMCRLLSLGRMRCEKGRCELGFHDIAAFSEGILAGVIVDSSSDEVALNHSRSFLRGPFRDVFDDGGYMLASFHRGVDDAGKAAWLRDLSLACDVPLLASGDVRYHTAQRMLLHDCLTAIANHSTIDDISAERLRNSQHHLRTLDEISELYRDVPDAIARTVEVASRCNFSLDELRYEYPVELAPPGKTPIEHLKRLAWEGAQQRWPEGVAPRVIEMLRHEFALIEELHYEAYFLTVWDLVRFARSQKILCQGRGSAANSAVCYCLGVTSVDPTQTDLLFERFISRERNEAPDIDVDFEHQRREEVLQYLYDKYGRDRAGLTATVTTYRSKSAIREVGKSLGISPDLIDAVAKLAGSYSTEPELPQRCRDAGLDPDTPLGKRFLYLTQTLVGFPRHLSQHVGGMVMTAGNLCELCVVENAAMPGRTVIQWNKDDLDELGILKVDVLALGMLSAIRRCFELVQEHHGRNLTLSTIPADDAATYDMICAADTMGVFQIESRAQMSMLPRLRPRCFYDLVIEVAIVRPGPIQGNMVHPFLAARENPDAAVYPNDAVRRVLEKTLGVPIFQEQAMRLAVVAAGFTPGEADQLRRAMAAWRRPGVIDRFRVKLLEGMAANGLSEDFAKQVFHQIQGFGEYGFPESHAASFALLVYASCYLKCHFPAAFCAALLDSQPMGFYAPAQLISDAQKHGVFVHGVDVNHSDVRTRLVADAARSGPAIRLGLQMIRGLASAAAERICHARESGGAFTDLNDLTRRADLPRGVIATLADADALASISADRRAAVWQSLATDNASTSMPLLASLEPDCSVPAELMSMSPVEEVHRDYETTGLSLKAHPVSFLRSQLAELGCRAAGELPSLRDGRHVRVAGIVLMRQRPATAKGITFVTIEDETGAMNLVMFAAVWKRFFKVARASNAWIVDGKLENRQGVIHVIVGRVDDMSDMMNNLPTTTRDFR